MDTGYIVPLTQLTTSSALLSRNWQLIVSPANGTVARHAAIHCPLDSWHGWTSERVGFNVPSTHYISFRRRIFPVSHLHWYWQPNKNNQETEHTNNTKQHDAKTGPAQDTLKNI